MDDEYNEEPSADDDPKHSTLRQWLRHHPGDGWDWLNGGPRHGERMLVREIEWRTANDEWFGRV